MLNMFAAWGKTIFLMAKKQIKLCREISIFVVRVRWHFIHYAFSIYYSIMLIALEDSRYATVVAATWKCSLSVRNVPEGDSVHIT